MNANQTQAPLGQPAGVSRPTIERMEAGQPARLDTFIRILKVLGPRAPKSSALQVDELIALASESLSERGELEGSIDVNQREDTLKEILQISSLGNRLF